MEAEIEEPDPTGFKFNAHLRVWDCDKCRGLVVDVNEHHKWHADMEVLHGSLDIVESPR